MSATSRKSVKPKRSKKKKTTTNTTTTATTPTANDDESVTDEVRNADFYHGLIPKVDAEALCKVKGDFLLRKTEHVSGVMLCISVRTEDRVRHFVVNTDDKMFFINASHKDKSIARLVSWYKTTKTPLSAASQAVLKKPVERPPWALNHDAIFCLKKLGQGAFGDVYLAEFVHKQTEKVAVKTMRGEANRDARNKFLKEARMMRKYDHKNVVKILGVAVHEHPMMIVMECCEGGSLLSYVQKNGKSCDPAEKLRFATESAAGLAYLASQQCVHRDIAARNVLLSAANVCKISDFGMSDDKAILHDDTLDKVPIKWLAPETLQEKIYSLKSDVWSFGIMVWEVYANGIDPYPGLTRLQVRAKIVLTAYRMQMPEGTPEAVGKIVLSCWEKESEARPDMSRVLEELTKAGCR